MQDEPAKNTESDDGKHPAQGARGGEPEDQAPSDDAEDSERLDLESLDIDGVKVGEGVREPDSPERVQSHHELEPGPTEVVSFASPRSKARLEEALGDDDTEGSLVRLPSLRSVQIVLFILINLIVLILGGYVIYRSLGSSGDEEESRLEAPAHGAAARFAARRVPRNGVHGAGRGRHTVTSAVTSLSVLEACRRGSPLCPWASRIPATCLLQKT